MESKYGIAYSNSKSPQIVVEGHIFKTRPDILSLFFDFEAKLYALNNNLYHGYRHNSIWLCKKNLPYPNPSHQLSHESIWIRPMPTMMKVWISYESYCKTEIDTLIQDRKAADPKKTTSKIGTIWNMDAYCGHGNDGFWLLLNFKHEHIAGGQMNECIELINHLGFINT